ncbi:MAG TPA: sulfur carrier protein ThiS [Solirubrobacteraceae bacterium]
MIVTVNGQRRELDTGATVATVVALLDVAPDARGVAVALDGEVVSRSRWSRTPVGDGAQLEVLSAIGGG